MIDLNNITDEEGRILVRALKRLRYESVLSMRQNERRDWQPEPGKVDVHVRVLEVIDAFEHTDNPLPDELDISPEALSRLYLDAISWTRARLSEL